MYFLSEYKIGTGKIEQSVNNQPLYIWHWKTSWVEWAIRLFRKHPKGSKFVCINSSLQFVHNLYLFIRNSKIPRTPALSQISVKLRITENKRPKYAQRKAFLNFRSMFKSKRFKDGSCRYKIIMSSLLKADPTLFVNLQRTCCQKPLLFRAPVIMVKTQQPLFLWQCMCGYVYATWIW